MLKPAAQFDASGLPFALIERYRTADGPALKVALYLLLGNSPTPEDIAAELSLPIGTVERSLDFWQRAGLLCENESAEETLPKKAGKTKVETVERRIPVTKMASCLRNPEIAALLQESQAYLGRTLTQNESERLLCIYEFDDLPVDVILMIVAYSKKNAKRNMMSYIERVAREWKEDGIDTIEKAEKHLHLLALREKRYKKVAELLESDESAFKYRERQYIDQWYEELGYDATFAEEAYLRHNNNSVAYINKILRSWSQKGYGTIKETREEMTNTAAPVPERRKKKKQDDLFARAVKETNLNH